MQKNEALTGLLNGSEVKIIGGYHQVKKGYLVGIETKQQEQKTISFTDLVFESQQDQAEKFEKIFGLSPEDASIRGHKKGVPEVNIFFHITSLETEDLSYNMEFDGDRLKVASL